MDDHHTWGVVVTFVISHHRREHLWAQRHVGVGRHHHQLVARRRLDALDKERLAVVKNELNDWMAPPSPTKLLDGLPEPVTPFRRTGISGAYRGRPTLTRTAAGAVIAGPVGALLGLAARKKVDKRELYLVVEVADVPELGSSLRPARHFGHR